MIARLLRTLIAKRRMDAGIKRQRMIRQARQEAARRGQATEHRNRIQRHKQTWGIG